MTTGFGNDSSRTGQVEPAGQHVERGVGAVTLQHAQVEPGGKHLLIAGDHDGARGVLLGTVERVMDFGLHRR